VRETQRIIAEAMNGVSQFEQVRKTPKLAPFSLAIGG
jgi:hypothetical protein